MNAMSCRLVTADGAGCELHPAGVAAASSTWPCGRHGEVTRSGVEAAGERRDRGGWGQLKQWRGAMPWSCPCATSHHSQGRGGKEEEEKEEVDTTVHCSQRHARCAQPRGVQLLGTAAAVLDEEGDQGCGHGWIILPLSSLLSPLSAFLSLFSLLSRFSSREFETA